MFAIIDTFTEFCWLYHTKSRTSEEVITRLKRQEIIFGNPRRIISDRGTAFTSHAFEEYYKEEGIEHGLITTGVPKGNGQVERLNRTIIPINTKLSIPKPTEWYRYVDRVLQMINSTTNRIIDKTQFEVLISTKIKIK